MPTEEERLRLGDLDREGDRDCDLDRERDRPIIPFPFLDDLDAFFLPARDGRPPTDTISSSDTSDTVTVDEADWEYEDSTSLSPWSLSDVFLVQPCFLGTGTKSQPMLSIWVWTASADLSWRAFRASGIVTADAEKRGCRLAS